MEIIEKNIPRSIRLMCIKTPDNLLRGVVGRYIIGTIHQEVHKNLFFDMNL